MKIILIILTSLLSSCAINSPINCQKNDSCLKPWGNSKVKGISAPMKFDIAINEYINSRDPPIQSFIKIARENKNSVLMITYLNKDCKDLSDRLYNLFIQNRVNVEKPQKKNKDLPFKLNETLVTVVIKFDLVTTKINSSNTKGN